MIDFGMGPSEYERERVVYVERGRCNEPSQGTLPAWMPYGSWTGDGNSRQKSSGGSIMLLVLFAIVGIPALIIWSIVAFP